QGSDREPTRHLGPTATAIERRTGQPSRKRHEHTRETAERLARSQEAGELESQGKAVEASILRLSSDIEVAKREKAIQQMDRRLAKMNSSELAQAIARLRPSPVGDLVERDPAVIKASQDRRALEEQHQEAREREAMARYEAEQWRRAHPLRAKTHDAGVFRSAYLDERAAVQAEARQEWLVVAPRIEDASLREQQARSEAEMRIRGEQSPIRAKVAKLEAMQQERSRQELAQRKRLEAEKKVERERAAVPESFARLARLREMGASGWSDRGSQWKAAPDGLRKLIDGYNAAPKKMRPAILSRIMNDGQRRDQVSELMAEQRQQYRSNDHGMSR
ncbi:hypothetical protein LH442_15325, partial [Laribacter hongkongensis]|uniref:hypothetical protein n=1 Tax=Laribacter hongkongensis TaxID=168471 RepID=UPI001EFE3636